MDDTLFGEGICSLPNKSQFVRLTWTDNTVHILDSDLEIIQHMSMFPGVKEGWGITHHDGTLFVSDGTEFITKIDTSSLKPFSKITVRMPNNQKVSHINELEYANGLLYANVFTTNYIVSIDPENGAVRAVYDFSALL